MNNGRDEAPALDTLINIHAVLSATSLSKASVYRLMNDGHFPKANALIPGGRRVAWRQSELMDWIASPFDWGRKVGF